MCIARNVFYPRRVLSGGLGDPELTWVPSPSPPPLILVLAGGDEGTLTWLGVGGEGTPFRSGYPLSLSWLGQGGTLTWIGTPPPERTLDQRLGRDLEPETGIPPCPPSGWTNKVKTLPSLVLRTRAIKMKMAKVCGNIKIFQIDWSTMYYFINF